MDDLRERLDDGVGNVVEERGLGVEVRKCDRLELKTLTAEVVVHEVEHVAVRDAPIVIESIERREDLLGRPGGRLVYKRLGVDIEPGDVHRLEELEEIRIRTSGRHLRQLNVPLRNKRSC